MGEEVFQLGVVQRHWNMPCCTCVGLRIRQAYLGTDVVVLTERERIAAIFPAWGYMRTKFRKISRTSKSGDYMSVKAL